MVVIRFLCCCSHPNCVISVCEAILQSHDLNNSVTSALICLF